MGTATTLTWLQLPPLILETKLLQRTLQLLMKRLLAALVWLYACTDMSSLGAAAVCMWL